MTKLLSRLVSLLALIMMLLVSAGCAEALGDVPTGLSGGTRAPSPNDTRDVGSRVATRDVGSRDFMPRVHMHRGVDFVECAQCRH
jgi:hypothetical protein